MSTPTQQHSAPTASSATDVRMDPALKARWIAALRSGHYKQCDGHLVTTDHEGGYAYCCLGVLRHIADPDDKRQGEDEDLLDKDQLAEFKLRDATQRLLAGKNDRGETFSQIADYIEESL